MLKITGELLRRKLAELVNALNLVLTFGADQPMLYTYNSFYRKYSYIRILYFFFSYILFYLFCAATEETFYLGKYKTSQNVDWLVH